MYGYQMYGMLRAYVLLQLLAQKVPRFSTRSDIPDKESSIRWCCSRTPSLYVRNGGVGRVQRK